MREIKFRVWDKHNEQWCYETINSICNAIYFNDTSALELPNSSCEDELPEIFCQFTGLKDKNGKEIYEGDILKHIEIIQGWNTTEEVEKLDVINMEHYNKYTQLWSMYEYEIIGNVYENPNLIGGR